MINWRLVWLFIFLVALQVLIINEVTLREMINPQLYPLFVIMLPFRIKGSLLLIMAFVIGLTIDMFSDSLAIHAAATVFMAFCRPAVLSLTLGPRQQDMEMAPSFLAMGGFALALYVLFLILLHHTMLFFLEVFSLTEFTQTLARIFLSSIFSFLIIMIAFALFERSKKRVAS